MKKFLPFGLLLCLILNIGQAFASGNGPVNTIFPLTMTDGRLYTRLGEPFLIIGDSPWSLIVGPDMAGVEKYMDDRKAKGVNSLLVNLVETYYNGPEDVYGNQPFITPGDFTTPNPEYFDHVDQVIGMALEKGIEVFLFPAYLGFDDGKNHKEGWYNAMTKNGPDNMYRYGKYLGQRYKDFGNIIWVMGGDCAPGNAMEEIRALVKGIEEAAGPQIIAVHNGRFQSGITEYPDEKWLDLNTTYADKNTTAKYLMEDNNRHFPFFYIEGTYEYGDISDAQLRSQMYLPVLMGSNGFFFGSVSLFEFKAGWEDSTVLESQGSRDMQRLADFFGSRPWYHLHPDMDHSLLTGGAGDIEGGDYAAAAVAEDSSYSLIYVPDYRKLTVNLNNISGTMTHVWWYQPSNGNTFDGSVISDLSSYTLYPPFESDWVLILEDASRGARKPRTVERTPVNQDRSPGSAIEKNLYADTTAFPTTFFIYPNPTHDEFHITESLSDKAQITIFDLQGKEILRRQLAGNTVDISSLPEGLYIVQLNDNERLMFTKLLKE
jgi:hypothetical protein